MRYSALDAVRGVAALAVVTHHCVLAGLIVIPAGAWTAATRYTPLHLFVNGRAAVILFFVLSGFVLSVSLENARAAYPPFAIRRFCRIYLPYAAMVLISALASVLTVPLAAPAGAWLSHLWGEAVDVGLIIRHLLMPVAGVDLTLDRVAWSLVHEIRVSMVFPLLWLCGGRAPRALLAVALALFAGGLRWSGCEALGCLPFNGVDTGGSFGATAYFLVFFVFGILLARQRPVVLDALRWVPVPARAVLWCVAVYGMIVPFKFEVLPDLAVGLSATLLLALVLSGDTVRRCLAAPPLAWLGRVSFSLYLCHLIVLALVVRIGAGADRLWLLAAMLAGSLA